MRVIWPKMFFVKIANLFLALYNQFIHIERVVCPNKSRINFHGFNCPSNANLEWELGSRSNQNGSRGMQRTYLQRFLALKDRWEIMDTRCVVRQGFEQS